MEVDVWRLALVACGCTPFPDVSDLVWEPWEASDVGEVCLWTQPQDSNPFVHAQSFEAGAPLQAVVSACFSGSCDRDAVIRVEADVPKAGGPVVLRTRVTWERVVPVERLLCTSDCRPATAVVDVPPFEAGLHEVVFDEQTMTVEVPGLQWACFDDVPVPR